MLVKRLLKITEHPVIASVLAGLILLGIAKIATQLDWINKTFTDIGVAFLNFILLILNHEVAIWKIFISIVMLLALRRAFIHFTKWKTAQESIIETTREAVEEIPTETRLTEDEEIILRIFMYDNSSLNIVEITNKNAVFSTKVFNQLRLDQLIEWLTNKNFLEPHFSYVNGTTYSLTRTGRDYILAHLMEQ